MRKLSAVLMCVGCGFGLFGCDNVNRSLVFFTNTTLGVEVGVDPTASSGKVIIGYKRAEGVINPVYQPPVSKSYSSAGGPHGSHSQTTYNTVESPDKVYRKEAYSVLAKIAGEAGGRGAAGPNASVDAAGKVSQWFATGKAADYLAKNEYAAAALTGSDKVAAAISQKRLGAALTTGGAVSRSARIAEIYQQVKALQDDGIAQALVADLDRLSKATLQDLGSFENVTYNPGDGYRRSVYTASQSGFEGLVEYASNAGTTFDNLGDLIAADSFTDANQTPHSQVTMTSELRSEYQARRDQVKELHDRAERVQFESPQVVAMVNYYSSKLLTE